MILNRNGYSVVLFIAVILLVPLIIGYLKSFVDTKSMAVYENYVRVVLSVGVKKVKLMGFPG